MKKKTNGRPQEGKRLQARLGPRGGKVPRTPGRADPGAGSTIGDRRLCVGGREAGGRAAPGDRQGVLLEQPGTQLPQMLES